jgi:hypothetical protein
VARRRSALRALWPPLDRDELNVLHQARSGRSQSGTCDAKSRSFPECPLPGQGTQQHARFARLGPVRGRAMGSRGCGAILARSQKPPELDDASAAMHFAHHRASSGRGGSVWTLRHAPSSVTMGSTSGKRVGGWGGGGKGAGRGGRVAIGLYGQMDKGPNGSEWQMVSVAAAGGVRGRAIEVPALRDFDGMVRQ